MGIRKWMTMGKTFIKMKIILYPISISGAKGDATILRPSVMCSVPAVLDKIYKGTIHILRKHLYSTKFNLITNFFIKTVFFRQNKSVYFSTLHFDKIFMLYVI